MRIFSLGPGRRQRGIGVVDVLAVTALIAVISLVSVPALSSLYKRYQVSSTTMTLESMIRRARMSALKEKISYRVVIHDESASTPNTIELQRRNGGSFVAVPGEVHTSPGAVRILGNSPTNSVDSVTINTRGGCTPGNVYVTAKSTATKVVGIATTCFTDVS